MCADERSREEETAADERSREEETAADERSREEETAADERSREEETPAEVLRVGLSEEPISLSEHEDLVAHEADGAAGAVVGFSGVVRDHDGGRPVTRLEYSAHPSALQTLTEVVHEVARDCQGVRAVAVSHRIGDLRIGDAALVVAVAADHRRAAFETCALLVDVVKDRLPVWKHQHFGDGSDEWVNSA